MHINSRLNAGIPLLRTVAHRDAATPLRRGGFCSGYITAVLRSLADIEGLWSILDLNGDATCFQSFEVFSSWARNIAPAFGADWFVLAVLDQATLLPLLLLPLTLIKSGGLRVIEAADLGVCDFNAPIIGRHFEPNGKDMAAIWKDAVALLPPADMIRLTKMPNTIGARANPLLQLGYSHKIKLSSFKTPLVTMGKRWSPGMLPEKLQLDLAARRRKLGKRGKLEFRIAQTQAEADLFFDAMVEQRAQRFEAMGRPDVLACPAHRAFYRSLIAPASRQSRAFIQALLLDGEPVATGYGLQSNDRFAMIFPAFKAEGWRNYSPGLQLFLESMTWAAQNGLAYYDFTIGGESFKLSLGALEYPLYEHLQPLTLRARPIAYRERLRHTVASHPRLKSVVEFAIPRNIHAAWRLTHAHPQR